MPRQRKEAETTSSEEGRVDVVVAPGYDGIAWRELTEGPIAEQRASTVAYEVADHADDTEEEGGPRGVSIPANQYDRLHKLGAVLSKDEAEEAAEAEAEAEPEPEPETPDES